jgi:hypothetical protein
MKVTTLCLMGVVLMVADHATSQTSFSDEESSNYETDPLKLPFAAEERCYTPLSQCKQSVAIQCRYKNAAGKESNCIDRDTTTQRPFLAIPEEECTRTTATISFRMCNLNDEVFRFNKTESIMKFRQETVDEPDYYDDIPANECRTYQLLDEGIDLCKKTRVIDIGMDGSLLKEGDNYCRCYLHRKSIVRYVSNEPSMTPTSTITDSPSALPSMTLSNPPSINLCDETKVIITELASPYDEEFGRYIELYFGRECKGKIINRNLQVQWIDGSFKTLRRLRLAGKKISEDGFYIICNGRFGRNVLYGDACNEYNGGTLSIADVMGNETIAVVERVMTNFVIIDMFGANGSSSTYQDFTNGRAVRKLSFTNPEKVWNPDHWVVIHGNGINSVKADDLDPGIWSHVFDYPKVQLIITEISEFSNSCKDPRFIEIYVPSKEDRGILSDKNLKLVTFNGNNTEPNWDTAIALDKVADNGFILVCNSAAHWGLYWSFNITCDFISDDISSPANSNGTDQIAIVNGNENNFLIVDLFGVIGEYGAGTPHDFQGSRVVRKINVTEPLSSWSQYDWIIEEARSLETTDALEWKELITANPSSSPSSPPSIEIYCEPFFTELAEPKYKATASYIEIKTSCPGALLKDFEIRTWKRFVFYQLFLNLKVSDDGFVIICQDKDVFESTYNKYCDVESKVVMPKGKFPIALLNNGKIQDIYGYPSNGMLPTSVLFSDGRAVRSKSSKRGLPTFDPAYWYTIPGEGQDESTTYDMDPRVWQSYSHLQLFFTEFADPVDDKSKRFIELYSPSRKNFTIDEDVMIVKFDASGPHDYMSLKGITINQNGFLVLCIDYWSELCTDVLPHSNLVNSPGTTKFALADCKRPPQRCPFIDTYGIGGDDLEHRYTNGRAVRRKGAGPTPNEIFYVDEWDIFPGGNGRGEVKSDDTDPDEWNESLRTMAPTPSWGKGKGKGKGAWRKRSLS